MSDGLHPAWLELWAPELPLGEMRSAILAQPRFVSRIEQGLLFEAFDLQLDLQGIDADRVALDAQAAGIDEALMRALGLAWCAPAFGTSLAPLTQVRGWMPDRDDLRTIVKFRAQTRPYSLSTPSSLAAVIDEGQFCLAAWLNAQDPYHSARLRLRLPPQMTQACDHQVDGAKARAHLSADLLQQRRQAAA